MPHVISTAILVSTESRRISADCILHEIVCIREHFSQVSERQRPRRAQCRQRCLQRNPSSHVLASVACANISPSCPNSSIQRLGKAQRIVAPLSQAIAPNIDQMGFPWLAYLTAKQQWPSQHLTGQQPWRHFCSQVSNSKKRIRLL